MSEMSIIARAALRQAVLEKRARLRESFARMSEAKRAYEEYRAEFRRHCDEIAALQQAAGDPIEIDPSRPDIQLESAPC